MVSVNLVPSSLDHIVKSNDLEMELRALVFDHRTVREISFFFFNMFDWPGNLIVEINLRSSISKIVNILLFSQDVSIVNS